MTTLWTKAYVYFDETVWTVRAQLDVAPANGLDVTQYFPTTDRCPPRGVSYLPAQRRLEMHCRGPVCVPWATVDAAVNAAWERKYQRGMVICSLFVRQVPCSTNRHRPSFCQMHRASRWSRRPHVRPTCHNKPTSQIIFIATAWPLLLDVFHRRKCTQAPSLVFWSYLCPLHEVYRLLW